jgi:hypothetical protein
MQEYMREFKKSFNNSQLDVMKRVAGMISNDILLV